MQFYWSINQIPELAGLSPEQAKQAWQYCYKKYAFKHWQTLASLVALGVLVAVGAKFFGLIGSALGGGIGGGIFGVITTNVLRPHLRDYVTNHFATTNSSTELSPDERSN